MNGFPKIQCKVFQKGYYEYIPKNNCVIEAGNPEKKPDQKQRLEAIIAELQEDLVKISPG
ncbi:hypothetical protein QWZ06_01375 [Chryseobacterium tructae]|uniref:hypothetical protein n=1 Tax=Chryseobacterium tructae TaxID=1037380 RepID=UPI0025B594EF|nr:hypothetical protein [Chryseobacterium tructae]MDN3691010.1 hypothetical protein [Chryseobacterium tructae]